MSKLVVYLAVLPAYRTDCIETLKLSLGTNLELFAGDKHLDETVRTGLPPSLVIRVTNHALLRRKVLLQTGHWKTAILSDVCVLDLNPRSLTVWIISAVRRVLRKRTLLWGHLHPRSGPKSRTAALRRAQRRISHGTILYGYDSVNPALHELPNQPVWVAPNSLYKRNALGVDDDPDRRGILYVGRLEQSKKVDQLIEAFTLSALWKAGYHLDIVGFGSMASSLESQQQQSPARDAITLHGRVEGPSDLRAIYRRAVFSVSPGYVGLSLTQSLGFGVPMLVSENEPHAPEYELKRFGGVLTYSPSDSENLGAAMRRAVDELNLTPARRQELAKNISDLYSAEAMAHGLESALLNRPFYTNDDGWPEA